MCVCVFCMRHVSVLIARKMEATMQAKTTRTSANVSYILYTMLLSGVVMVVLYWMICHFLSRTSQSYRERRNSSKNSLTQKKTTSDAVSSYLTSKHENNTKRIKQKKKREPQEFSHHWKLATLKGHTGSIYNMSVSGNRKYVASCAEDRTVLLWYTKDFTAKDRKSLRVNIEFDHATLIRWSPDGKAFIIHKALANTIEVYKITKKPDGHLASATKALEFPQRHTEDVVGMDIACTGKYIITCSKANDLVVWDLKGQPLTTIELHLGSTYRARISPCGRFVAASGFTPDVNVFEVVFNKSGEFKHVAKAFDLGGHTSGVYDFGFNADSSRMATVSKDGTYRFYDTKIEYEKGEDPHVLMTGTWDTATPASLVLSPDADVLVIAHGSSVSFYSTITGALDTTIDDIFLGPITCLTFDAMGEYLLVAGDKHIQIFRNVTGYRTAIESAKRKLEQRQTQATKERLEKLIRDNKELLEKIGEKCP